MLANASRVLSNSAPEKSRPLAARRSNDLDPTLAAGTAESGTHSLSTGFESPPDPLKNQIRTNRRSPPQSHIHATTTK